MPVNAIALVLTLLAESPPPLPSAPQPTNVELEGKVREVRGGQGTATQAILELDDRRSFALHGQAALDEVELRNLAGARVRIRGIKDDPRLQAGSHLLVLGFEILDVGGGVAPRLGRLARLSLGGKERLLFVEDSGRASLLPAGFAAKLGRSVGARVWMVGTESGNELVPTRFAILRPSAEAPKNESDPPKSLPQKP